MIEGGQHRRRVRVHVPREILLVKAVHRDQQHVLNAVAVVPRGLAGRRRGERAAAQHDRGARRHRRGGAGRFDVCEPDRFEFHDGSSCRARSLASANCHPYRTKTRTD